MPIAKIVKDASLTESLSDRRLSLARAQQVAREDRLGEPRNAAVEPFAPTSQDATACGAEGYAVTVVGISLSIGPETFL